jgi:hypothetical protein
LAIGRFVPEPFEIAGRTITPQNLYIGLFVIGTSESYYERQVRGRCNGSVRGAKHREAQWPCSAQLSAVLFAETARSVRTCERGSAMIIKHLCRRDRERALTCTGLPLLWWSAPLSTFFWLVGSSGCLVGAHAGLLEPGVEACVSFLYFFGHYRSCLPLPAILIGPP